jgi:hypothetical protein
MTHPGMFGARKRRAMEAPVEIDWQLVRHTIHKAHLDRFYGPLFEDQQSRNG